MSANATNQPIWAGGDSEARSENTIELNPPQPKATVPVRKRILAVAFLVIAISLGSFLFVMKQRAEAIQAASNGTATVNSSAAPVRPISDADANAVVDWLSQDAASTLTGGNVGAPPTNTNTSTTPSNTPAVPTSATPNGNASQINPATAPPPNNPALTAFQKQFPFTTPPDYLLRPLQQPQSSLNTFGPAGAPGFSQGVNQGQPVESEAELWKRMDRAARMAGTRVDLSKKLDGGAASVSSGQTAATGTGSPASFNGGNEIQQIGELARSLMGTAQQQNAATAPQQPQTLAPAKSPAVPPTSEGGPSSEAEENPIAKQLKADTTQTFRVTSLTPYQIKAGWNIPCRLTQDLDSQAPGQIKCQVAEDVRDTRTGKFLLIPKGADIMGTYKPSANMVAGQSAIETIWLRIIFPDASSLDLDGLLGQDQNGQAGLRGHVNNHFRQIITATALNAVVSAGTALAFNRTGAVGLGVYPSPGQAAEAGASSAIQETGSRIIQRAMNIPPTVHVNAGQRFNVQLDKDINFDEPFTPRKPLLPEVPASNY